MYTEDSTPGGGGVAQIIAHGGHGDTEVIVEVVDEQPSTEELAEAEKLRLQQSLPQFDVFAAEDGAEKFKEEQQEYEMSMQNAGAVHRFASAMSSLVLLPYRLASSVAVGQVYDVSSGVVGAKEGSTQIYRTLCMYYLQLI